MAVDRVRYVGEPVVLVVADTRAESKDAADLVNIDYDPIPSVALTEDSVKPGAPATEPALHFMLRCSFDFESNQKGFGDPYRGPGRCSASSTSSPKTSARRCQR